MKNSFDFSRFVQVFRLSWQTQPLLPYIILIAAIPLMYLTFFMDARHERVSLEDATPLIIFGIYLLACGWLYAGMIFSDLGRQGSATRYLMLPGSTIEKWLAKSLLVWIVFPVIGWIAFNVAFHLFEFFSVRWFAFRYDLIYWRSSDMFVVLFFFYLGLPAAYASGLVWKRFGIWKGLVFVFTLFLILFNIINIGMYQYPFGSGYGVLMNAVEVPFFETDHDTATRRLARLFWPLAMYIPGLLLLSSTYFFIKGKEL